MTTRAPGPLAVALGHPLVLASGSPRRREMLESLGVEVRVRSAPPGVETAWEPGDDPHAFVLAQARAKAEAVAASLPAEVACDVLAADTVVVLDDRVLEKPRDAAQAAAMLRRLAGRQHTVLTGVALLGVGPGAAAARAAVEETAVTFAPLREEEIAAYIATGEPFDKAGAYGIQGHAGVFVTRIDGCYYNVVGLPLPRVYRMLRARRGDLQGE